MGTRYRCKYASGKYASGKYAGEDSGEGVGHLVLLLLLLRRMRPAMVSAMLVSMRLLARSGPPVAGSSGMGGACASCCSAGVVSCVGVGGAVGLMSVGVGGGGGLEGVAWSVGVMVGVGVGGAVGLAVSWRLGDW